MASRGVGVRRRWIFGKRRTGLRAKEHRYCDTERRSACEKALYQDYRPHACRLAFQRGNGWMHKNPVMERRFVRLAYDARVVDVDARTPRKSRLGEAPRKASARGLVSSNAVSRERRALQRDGKDTCSEGHISASAPEGRHTFRLPGNSPWPWFDLDGLAHATRQSPS